MNPFAGLFSFFTSPEFSQVLHWLWVSAPVWAPFILGAAAWQLWVVYVRLENILNEKYVVLEVRLPRESLRPPRVMEIILAALYYTGGESTFIDKYWDGKVRPWWSLEIVSIEGRLHFYIWTRSFLRNFLEAQIYGQYPTVELVEVPDYTLNTDYDPAKTSLWGCYFRKEQSDPYPIKTYIDYGLDKEGTEEEEKVDPITSVLEYMGGIGKGEQIWIQIMLRAHRKELKTAGALFSRGDWSALAKKEIDKLMKRDKKPVEGQFNFGEFLLTKGERTKVEAIERNIGKLPFDVGIRGIYIGTKENFNPMNIPGLIGAFRQYNTKDLNNFKFYDWTDFDYPWQDFRNIRKDSMKRKIIRAYKLRSFFHQPYKQKPFVMSAEELATIYHFPGRVATTPTIERIPSRKGEAPSNLPV